MATRPFDMREAYTISSGGICFAHASTQSCTDILLVAFRATPFSLVIFSTSSSQGTVVVVFSPLFMVD